MSLVEVKMVTLCETSTGLANLSSPSLSSHSLRSSSHSVTFPVVHSLIHFAYGTVTQRITGIVGLVRGSI